MKVLLFNLFIFTLVFSFENIQAAPDYNAEDFTFDATTSTLVPKFMGKVILIRGKVYATNSEGRRQLSKGNKVYKKDTISTTANGITKIELVDQTIITLNKNSEFNVSKWKYIPQKGERDAIINLLRGQMRTHFKVKAQKRNKLEVKVNNIAMGVRGTKVLANARTDKTGREITQIALIEGYGRMFDQNNDKQRNMISGDHYISIIGPNVTKTKMDKISKKEIKRLLLAGKNPKKDYSFLGNYDITKMGMSNNQSDQSNSSKSNTKRKNNSSKEDGWKDTMDQLNQRLDEYNE
jgi:hypothetical protein